MTRWPASTCLPCTAGTVSASAALARRRSPTESNHLVECRSWLACLRPGWCHALLRRSPPSGLAVQRVGPTGDTWIAGWRADRPFQAAQAFRGRASPCRCSRRSVSQPTAPPHATVSPTHDSDRNDKQRRELMPALPVNGTMKTAGSRCRPGCSEGASRLQRPVPELARSRSLGSVRSSDLLLA
jgi:hypothetical protein